MWNIRKTVKKGAYLYAVVPEHPKSIRCGYVLMHRVVMENHLGRILGDDEVVHHKDENKHNNEISNLEVQTNSAHASAHGRTKGRLRVELKCPACKRLFERWKNVAFGAQGKIFVACSPRCRGLFSRKMQLFGRTNEVEVAISENLVREYRYFRDNPEETDKKGSVETTRDSPEMVKI